MTNEEMQRAMEFIVETEAKSSAKIYALAEAQKQTDARADERWARADELWARTEDDIRRLLSKVRQRHRS